MTADKRPIAIAGLFIACAELIPRAGRSYDEWLAVVTATFKRTYRVIERAA